ncbi:MAG: S-methyl-5'-thioadenosine phosphorylase [Rhizobacter sp.]
MAHSSVAVIGVIGGSGLYRIEGLEDAREIQVETPYGPPSDAFMMGTLQGVPVVFLARHGRHHSLTPSEIPFLANVWAFKSLGVRYLVSLSAVGSMKEEMAPLDAVLPDQFIDLTRQRPRTFFGQGIVAHAAMGRPVCPALHQVLGDASEAIYGKGKFGQGRLHRGGSYVCIEGPQFSTLAESKLYRSWGADIIGMTNMPEARLAREAEIAYATVGLVTDYDCWHESFGHVTADMAIANLTQNAGNAQALVREVVQRLHAAPPTSIAHNALDSALITPGAAMPIEAKQRLQLLMQRVLVARGG